MYNELSIEDYKADYEDSDKDIQLIDVREVEEYDEVHIPGTTNVPLSEFQERVGEIDKDKTVVLVCRTGGRSAMAAEFLVAQGYEDVHNLLDGTLGWVRRGHDAERGA